MTIEYLYVRFSNPCTLASNRRGDVDIILKHAILGGSTLKILVEENQDFKDSYRILNPTAHARVTKVSSDDFKVMT